MPDIQTLETFHTHLHQWYKQHGRHNLPWRKTQDPYAIYLSEVMLQQTQVETVLQRFYFPFLQKFPDLKTLAAASREEVLKSWQGLGYYSRAIHLHATAKQIEHLPTNVEDLMALPGIGRNTAHAVAAFAYRLPVAIMEANVRRILHRIFALEKASETLLWEKAASLLDATQPFDYNQAMMDLGSLVCTAKAPDCTRCPANLLCLGKSAPERYPLKLKSKRTPTRRKKIVVLEDPTGRIYATPRTTRFLHGLYHFIEVNGEDEYFTYHNTAYPLSQNHIIGAIRQTYSHFTLEATIYRCSCLTSEKSNYWHTPPALSRLPWSGAEHKILKLLKL